VSGHAGGRERHSGLQRAQHGDRSSQDGRLLDRGRAQLLIGAVGDPARERLTERVVGLGQHGASLGKLTAEIAGHSHALGSLAREHQRVHQASRWPVRRTRRRAA
jgi:hypothetical protein